MLDDTDRHADFTRTRAGYFFLVDDFRTSLPEPPKETPEKRQQRLQAAISAVASLCPVNLAEARLAARHVSADEEASECLRLANQLRHNLPMQLKCRAQSVSMARQSESALRTLLRLQAMRTKRDARPETADAAAWAEHIALSAMTAALAPAVPENLAPAVRESDPGLRTETAAPSGHEETEAVRAGTREAVSDTDAPAAANPSEVEVYETRYPERAALIRRHGGVPANVSFGPPGEEIVRALLVPSPAASQDAVFETQSHYA